MKKRYGIIGLCLWIGVAAGLTGCKGQDQPEETLQQETEVSTGAETIFEEMTVAEKYLDLELTEEQKAQMVPVLNAVFNCYMETGAQYQPGDEGYFWSAMYYAMGSIGQEDPSCTMDESTGRLTVPFTTALNYAQALFADFEVLPMEFLEKQEDSPISYDEDSDSFLVNVGEQGMAQTEIVQVDRDSSGIQRVQARFYDSADGTDLAVGTFSLYPEEMEGMDETIFPLRVMDVSMREAFPND